MKPNRTQPQYPISAGQRTAIKMAQHQLGLADDDYRAMLKERYGVDSCTRLTFRQAGHFIQELTAKGFVLTPKEKPQQHPRPRRAAAPHGARPAGGNVVCLVKPEEIDKLNQVAALIQWRVKNGLALFLEKRMGIKGGKVVTSDQAYYAIEGLKKMFENSMKKSHGPAWWTMQYDNQAIIDYIAIHKPAEWR